MLLILQAILASAAATRVEGAAPNPATYQLEISRLPLEEALLEFAHQSGTQILFFSRITQGLSAPALSGRYTMADAMTRLLADSGLTFRILNPRTIEVRQAAPPGSTHRRAQPSAREPNRPSPTTQPLAEVRILGTAEQLVATRVPTPLSEIPQSISVVSSEQIRQQNDFDLADLLKYAPGFTVHRLSSLDELSYSRAFQVLFIHVDGGGALRQYLGDSPLFRTSPDLSEFERVEVLRGSDALFAGNSNPGATVSLVRKRPLATPGLDVTATLGSWNNQRVEIDATGPIAGDGALRARADAVYSRRDYFFDRANLERKKLFATLEYDLSSNSTLTAGGSIQWDAALPLYEGVPLYNLGRDSHLPRNTSLTFDWAFENTTLREAFLQYRQQLSGDWRIIANAAEGRASQSYGYGYFVSNINKTGGLGQPSAGFSTRPGIFTQDTADVTLTGRLDWLGAREELAVGADFARLSTHLFDTSYSNIGPPLLDVHAFDPSAYPDPRGTQPLGSTDDFLYTLEQYGAFASLRVEFNAGWAATLGGRVSTNTYKIRSTLTQLAPLPQLPFQAGYGSSGVITPFAALMYKIDDHYSWYASYADIYLGQLIATKRANGTIIGPKQGVTLETGMKGVWRDGALNGSVAIYRTTQSNEPFIDSTVPPTSITGSSLSSPYRYYTATIRSRGADLQLDGELRPGWLICGGYTYNFSRDGNGSLLFTATPLHLLKVWTSIRLPGDLARWTIGGSVRAQTPASYGIYLDCTGVSGNCPDVQLDQKPSAVLDSRVEFEIDPHWRVALNVNNVLDKTYYETIDSNQAWYGEPRNFMLRVEAKY